MTSSIPAPPTAEVAPRLPVEMLTEAMPVSVTGERETSGRVEVTLRDLYRKNHRLYLRYAVVNHTAPGTYPFARLPGFWKASALSSPSFRLENASSVKSSREALEPMPQPWWSCGRRPNCDGPCGWSGLGLACAGRNQTQLRRTP